MAMRGNFDNVSTDSHRRDLEVMGAVLSLHHIDLARLAEKTSHLRHADVPGIG